MTNTKIAPVNATTNALDLAVTVGKGDLAKGILIDTVFRRKADRKALRKAILARANPEQRALYAYFHADDKDANEGWALLFAIAARTNGEVV